MRIIELLEPGKQFLSLEFFPPKESADWPAFFQAVDNLRSVNPLFVSVTYGAGGGTQANTLEIVTRLKQDHALEPMAHLTCVGATAEGIKAFLHELALAGVDNVLALRGDPPQDGAPFVPTSSDFVYAADLVSFIRSQHPGMGIGVAGYPEGHPEAKSLEADLAALKTKLDQGGDFVVSQLFFHNHLYWNYVQRARQSGVHKPIFPGIMPIFSLKVIKKVLSLCGASIDPVLLRELEEAHEQGGNDAVKAVGIRHARNQISELLAAGAPGIHLYTLNRDDACLELLDGLF